jgi:hypothetical protein
MSKEENYQTLFRSLQSIVDEEPQSVPQLLAVILAGGPFRPFLDKPELLSKAVIMAKQYVASKKVEAQGMRAKADASPPTAKTPTPQRRPSSVGEALRRATGPFTEAVAEQAQKSEPIRRPTGRVVAAQEMQPKNPLLKG